MTIRLVFCVLICGLSACGDNKARYVIPPSDTGTEVRLRVSSIEVRDVSLPAYAAASEIVIEDTDGALRPVAKAIWADDPPRAITGALARSLDVRSSAAVSAEPWPLSDAADVRLEVRVSQMIARADGVFSMTGQFALASQSGAIRDTLQRFEIDVPLADTSPASVATATGNAIDTLAEQILSRLTR